jgi:glycosyltransferase involved in cell wall biosynthesis
VLEALACGVPVVCANTSSLPELAGPAALTVDPLDTAALAGAIERLLTDADLARALLARAPAQLARFSWSAAAEAVLGVLLAVARGERPTP